MDSLNGFTVFVKIAETGSIVAAGRSLGISASAVGKSLIRLEEKIGVRLFHRNTRSINLTAEGILFLERSRRILAEIEAAEMELSQAIKSPKGRLRVSLPLVSSLVLPVLGDFMQEYPEIELDLDFADRLVDVIEEGFDAVVRTGTPTDSRLKALKLGTFKQLLVASPAYLIQRGTPIIPADLLEHSCLHYRFSHSGKLEKWPLKTTENEPDLQLPISMICNNIETRVCFALKGRGIACLPDFSIKELLSTNQLVQVLPEFTDGTGVFNVLWPASKHPSPKVRAFVNFLSERMFEK
ncbi:LysR family transcriptional regulator [Acinetobacter sp. XS-4]|uniref:LysR family transcriptional regulator n=1 Tax=Acinetobacter sp. XS-4 TaxID=2923375 RepID=UPI00208FF257|nr:LysR family transcriptional regulator [Acinetobacter sp. XS-4]USP39271.1 LysR family transcriptional regulator [Acinetobacter sp. XS-4]